jgi:addiction module HigA family antidote
MDRKHIDLQPSHPGELLREIVVPASGKSKREIAEAMGISRQTLYDIMMEKQPITSANALRLGKYFGNGADLWLDMQKAYDLCKMEREMKPMLDNIIPLKAA